VGLAEVMNYPQVIGGEKLMPDILQAARESPNPRDAEGKNLVNRDSKRVIKIFPSSPFGENKKTTHSLP
jgi:adenine deaminase